MDWQNEISVPPHAGHDQIPQWWCGEQHWRRGEGRKKEALLVVVRSCTTTIAHGLGKVACSKVVRCGFFVDSEGVVTVTPRLVVENRCLIACNLLMGTCM